MSAKKQILLFVVVFLSLLIVGTTAGAMFSNALDRSKPRQCVRVWVDVRPTEIEGFVNNTAKFGNTTLSVQPDGNYTVVLATSDSQLCRGL